MSGPDNKNGAIDSSSSLVNSDILPTRPEMRTVTGLAFLVICIGMYVQLAAIISGAQLYDSLSPVLILLSALIGNLLVWVFLVLNGDVGLRHGIPYSVYMRAPFGYFGAHIPGIVRAFPALFWFGFQTWLGAYALNEIMIIITGYSNLTLLIVLLGAVQIINSAYGVGAIEKFNWIAVPIMIAISAFILIYLVTQYEVKFDSFLHSSGNGEVATPFLTAVAIMAGQQITMAVNIADFTRFLKVKRTPSDGFFRFNSISAVPQLFGLVLPMLTFIGIGIISGISTGEWNPIDLLTEALADYPIVLIFVLASFVVLAQMSSNTSQNLLPPGYIFSNIYPKKIKYSTAVVAAGIIGLLMRPWIFADDIPTIFLLISSLLGPIVGIMVTDYYIIRKKNLNVPELYRTGGQYRYVKNINPAALISMVPGALLGLLFSDFAFFVSMITVGVLYWVLMKTWILKKYPQAEISKPSK